MTVTLLILLVYPIHSYTVDREKVTALIGDDVTLTASFDVAQRNYRTLPESGLIPYPKHLFESPVSSLLS